MMRSSMERPAFDAPAADWLVYGDALQETGNPLGELIGLVHAAMEGRNDGTPRDRYVETHGDALFGELDLSRYAFDWHYGLVKGVVVRVQPGDGDLVTPLLASPLCAELRALELRGVSSVREGSATTVDLTAAMEAALARVPPTCTAFAFVDDRAVQAEMLVSRDFDPPANLVTFGPIAPFYTRAESLRLEVADLAQLALGELDAPNLRELVVRPLRFAGFEELGDQVAWLARARWPKLESFELRCVEMWIANVPEEHEPYIPVYSADDYEGRDDTDEGDTETVDWRGMTEVFRSLARCPLRRLALTSAYSMHTLIPALAQAGLAPTLRELDFTDGCLGSADDLLAHRAAFASLEAIVLDGTPLVATELARLADLGPRIVHSPGVGARYRYVVGQE
jgi:hypothetical protein